MSQEALKKLASIFARQQKILEKLSGMEESEELPPTVREPLSPASAPVELSMLEEDLPNEDLPHDFMTKLNNYQRLLSSRDPVDKVQAARVMDELKGVAEGNPASVKEFGKYFKGWRPEHFKILFKMLRIK